MTGDKRLHFKANLDYVQALYDALGESFGTPLVPMVLYGIGIIADHPGVSQLAECVGLSLKDTSRILGLMRKRGWLKLEADPEDTRKRRVVMTAKGNAVLRMINSAWIATCMRVAEDVTGRKLRERTEKGGE